MPSVTLAGVSRARIQNHGQREKWAAARSNTHAQAGTPLSTSTMSALPPSGVEHCRHGATEEPKDRGQHGAQHEES